jgi:hypothetical protein
MNAQPPIPNLNTSPAKADCSVYKSLFTLKIESVIENGPPLVPVLILAAVVRMTAAILVDYLAAGRGAKCLFGDTEIYWQYGLAIATGKPYVVYQWEVSHYALRTPGYPLWLGFWIRLFGDWTLAIRLGQSALGVLSVWWIYLLAIGSGCSARVSRLAALLLAIDPFASLQSNFLLTESIFSPLLLFFLLIWTRQIFGSIQPQKSLQIAIRYFFVGSLQAILALIRPAWGPFLILLLVINLFVHKYLHRYSASVSIKFNLMMITGWLVVVMPWALRNESVIGRPAIGGTWGGASLYDGVRPGADGTSEMSFVAAPEFRDLSETDQDDRWKALSWQEIRQNPARIARLALVKQGRFWSAWPLERSVDRWWLRLASGLVVWPIWLLVIPGLYKIRHKYLINNCLILFLPLLFTAFEHTLFVGSSRYRVAVFAPVLIIAAEGLSFTLSQSGLLKAIKKNQPTS